jgi:hypothetical protein
MTVNVPSREEVARVIEALPESLGLSYDQDTYDYNVASVRSDIKAGRVRQPATEQEWVSCIVTEFQANAAALMAAVRGGRLRIFISDH